MMIIIIIKWLLLLVIRPMTADHRPETTAQLTGRKGEREMGIIFSMHFTTH